MILASSSVPAEWAIFGFIALCVSPVVVGWFRRQNAEIALSDAFQRLEESEKEALQAATMLGTLHQLTTFETQNELRELAIALTKRNDRIVLIKAWMKTHFENQDDKARRFLASL